MKTDKLGSIGNSPGEFVESFLKGREEHINSCKVAYNRTGSATWGSISRICQVAPSTTWFFEPTWVCPPNIPYTTCYQRYCQGHYQLSSSFPPCSREMAPLLWAHPIGSLGRLFDRPVIGGDLVGAHVPHGWGNWYWCTVSQHIWPVTALAKPRIWHKKRWLPAIKLW